MIRSFVMTALLAVTMTAAQVAQAADPIVQNLQDISVTVKSGAGGGQGSGVVFTRPDSPYSYIWTAGHVVDNLRKTRNVIVNGTQKTVVEFGDATIVQEFREEGRRIGEQTMDAQVVRFSDADNGRDVALLRVRKKNFTTNTAVFYNGEIPPIGTELYHVGSLLGQFGSNSLTTGVVSQIGRVLDLGANGVVFDQTSATAFPGSSGGGMFLKENGQYMGMLVRGSGEQFNFVVPVRELRAWAKEAKVEWALDPTVPLPSEAELKKLPIEDAGVTFDANAEKAAAANKKYPFFLYEECGEPTLADPLEPTPAG